MNETAASRLIRQRMLQEKLADADLFVSLGMIQGATETQFEDARLWVETYLLDPKACTIERPAWLPESHR